MSTRESAVSVISRSQLSLLRMLAGLVMLAALAAPVLAQGQNTSAASDQSIVHQLLDAMAQNDYQGFTSQGTTEFAAVGEPEFAQVAGAIAPRLQQGYTVQYLGKLQQQGLDISVWKISFQDQGDDLLATLNVQNGRVGGFFLR